MEKVNDLISVMVPIYNVQNYLSKCIESIQNQTYKNLEIILVDDGSTDSCPQICDEYASKDKRIRVIHKSNGGRSTARNAALEIATGDSFMFVDGDDWIDENCVEALLREMQDVDAQLVVGRYRSVYTDTIVDGGTGERLILSGQEPLEFYVRGKSTYQNSNSVCVKLYKRELVGDIRFVEGKFFEDVMFVTKVFAKCTSCVYCDQAYYNYNIATPTSITFAGVIDVTFRDEIPCFYEKEQFLKDLGREDLARTYAFFRYERMLTYYRDCFRGKTAKNRSYAKKMREIICGDRKYIQDLCRSGEGNSWSRFELRLFLINGTIYRWYYNMMKWYGERKNRKYENIA